MILSNQTDGHLHVIALIRGREKYLWLYTPDKVIDLFSSFCTYAALPCYSFTWVDAAALRANVLVEMAKVSGVKR